ncbi:MAG TPA: CDP-glucose 4,6-dehydratase, partial [Ferruginibacter sp.]|nr:CDP-glucose 4,6-dehydratase [Ferruginibacter sp.]
LEKPCVVVLITTDKVYENKEQDVLYAEDDVLGGYDPYSASKACTELIIQSFRRSFFPVSSWHVHHKSLVSARAGNVIGGGDFSEDRIVPDIVRALRKEEPVLVRNPESVRPWQHVLEPLGAYLLLGGALHQNPEGFNGAYNFGPYPDDHLTVRELVNQSISSWGKGEWIDGSTANQPHEAKLLKLDISRAMRELNWKPKLNAADAIAWTINWYKQEEDLAAGYTIAQIKRYMEL